MKTHDVRAALRSRFCAPEWALFFEVGDATGGRHNRWADAVAINLYPSRGLEIHGFEIKVSRSDWLRELKNPEKSAPVQQYCDRWWIVCPAGVIVPGELPPTWGQYEIQAGGKIRQITAAPKLSAQPVTRTFVAAMLRRASEADEGLVEAAVSAEVQRLRDGDEKRIAREIESRTSHVTDLQAQIEQIERVSGIKIHRWGNSEEIGKAVRAVMASGVLKSYGGMNAVREHAASIVKQCDEALAVFAVSPAADELAVPSVEERTGDLA
ncbi:hypothetical protein [Paraburkholderia tropica]|uniref:hypothetical protein n=1 Tax=Paraburkholderia tropica TaxID=92647 RepID=UPI0016142171|nr:hypothetical protein [Paraburkholderia tropica]MBB2981802.1 polyhydroxyalkanoate synthesis regulator phasin [Paraburkholderia tropica]